MAKGKKLKETKRLRREVEALRAQLSRQPESGKPSLTKTEVAKENLISLDSDTKLISKDIIKTLALSALAFSIIISVWLYQNGAVNF